VHPANLQAMCGECHPGITQKMAQQPIHGVSGKGLRTPAADIVGKIYIIAIIVIIGLMVLHWVIDLVRQIKLMIRRGPQVLRMTLNEVWQHFFLMATFIVLVISGFALRFSDSWLSEMFFGWEGGFELRGAVHRFAAVLFIATVVWHAAYLSSTRRGRAFFKDMLPLRIDVRQFWRRILHNLGLRKNPPRYGRFNYVEKAEYWALIWGSAVMVVSGLLLWFDNWFIHILPKGVLDVALVVHYYEAWLATLAIFVWHLYSTVFSPHVYPMNPSWLTGKMPEEMYRREHPKHFETAREETEEQIRAKLESFSMLSYDPEA
jgi:formate dehydrogenase gamma subunit